ncbi:hypothetical protein GCM10011529_27550 [Polymorphobacter glacialis]|uniref:Uncharacterized protein n=1 Tax=Sandarakinorhabdus glacialis TaxID=1614636 RepID=A0A916ZYY1_9SPHN|nr:hypothetical protein [Polymorphobacter glacialis]GGE19487.1 hypothetical protein GCM10011529_27550 [Polymorphobacter glacialis]
MQYRLSIPAAFLLVLSPLLPVSAQTTTRPVGTGTALPPRPATPAAGTPALNPANLPLGTLPSSVPALPVKKGGFMVPKAIELRTLTPAETEANAIWNMRAALNVAALQCQFSNYLATVKTYNAMLKQHSDELSKAQKTMIAHFKRYDGAKALNNFDVYTTRTYNSYSTLDAQYTFCAVAGVVGKDVLATPRGKMGPIAMLRNPEIRASLGEIPLSPALAMRPVDLILLPDISAM